MKINCSYNWKNVGSLLFGLTKKEETRIQKVGITFMTLT